MSHYWVHFLTPLIHMHRYRYVNTMYAYVHIPTYILLPPIPCVIFLLSKTLVWCHTRLWVLPHHLETFRSHLNMSEFQFLVSNSSSQSLLIRSPEYFWELTTPLFLFHKVTILGEISKLWSIDLFTKTEMKEAAIVR